MEWASWKERQSKRLRQREKDSWSNAGRTNEKVVIESTSTFLIQDKTHNHSVSTLPHAPSQYVCFSYLFPERDRNHEKWCIHKKAGRDREGWRQVEKEIERTEKTRDWPMKGLLCSIHTMVLSPGSAPPYFMMACIPAPRASLNPWADVSMATGAAAADRNRL